MLRAVLLISATALAACDVGEVKINGGMVDAGGGASAAKIAMFESTIKPMAMALGCLDAGCHSGTVLTPILNTFESLAARYKTGPNGATNILVTKGGTPAPGTHSAKPYFSDAQRATIAAWIDMQ